MLDNILDIYKGSVIIIEYQELEDRIRRLIDWKDYELYINILVFDWMSRIYKIGSSLKTINLKIRFIKKKNNEKHFYKKKNMTDMNKSIKLVKITNDSIRI